MNKKLKKVIESDGSTYYVDCENKIQGKLISYSDGKIEVVEHYKDSCLHGKKETYHESGEITTEYFFYGRSIGFDEEGEQQFELLNKSDIIKERFEVDL